MPRKWSVDEMLRLSEEDPEYWTTVRLGKEFGVSPSTISRNRRPEVMRERREAARQRYETDPEYRQREQEAARRRYYKRRAGEPTTDTESEIDDDKERPILHLAGQNSTTGK